MFGPIESRLSGYDRDIATKIHLHAESSVGDRRKDMWNASVSDAYTSTELSSGMVLMALPELLPIAAGGAIARCSRWAGVGVMPYSKSDTYGGERTGKDASDAWKCVFDVGVDALGGLFTAPIKSVSGFLGKATAKTQLRAAMREAERESGARAAEELAEAADEARVIEREGGLIEEAEEIAYVPTPKQFQADMLAESKAIARHQERAALTAAEKEANVLKRIDALREAEVAAEGTGARLATATRVAGATTTAVFLAPRVASLLVKIPAPGPEERKHPVAQEEAQDVYLHVPQASDTSVDTEVVITTMIVVALGVAIVMIHNSK